ncbi:MAG: FIG018171: hypothetical protein of Cupin superfamily [uncultured Thiotrichaceae bacterium]|uniref:DUF985 domain-containing protein n=1 Tax=uncultured Thiotrichaceae bacterium TaxID=298394 RepID=A0A6S6S4L4_9GAMM|nr:MAG: FIG018171: hypothetical protein of Cupin superfamily [uncultured Thiotrichaceae bacterium]
MKAKDWIQQLELLPHPEGGFFKEVYRATEAIPQKALPERFTGERNFSTSIYFLLTADTFSAFHRIKQDELWHFYDGTPLTLHRMTTEGEYLSHQLGRNPFNNESLQLVVPAGDWFAASVTDQTKSGDFSLVGCTVSPGFDFADFEMPNCQSLIKHFPAHAHIIKKLTHS